MNEAPVVAAIYDAALDASRWPAALRAIAAAVGGTACGLRFESFTTPALSQRWIGLEPAWESAYVAHYWQDDVWATRAKAHRPGLFAASDTFIDAKTRRTSAFINELCAAYEIDDLVGGVLSLTSERMISFAAMKRRGRRPFDDEHAAVIGSIVPHVRRVLMIEEALSSARDGERVAWSIVDRFPIGAIILDARRRVLHQNLAANAMIDAGLVLDSRPIRELVTTLRPRRIAVGPKLLTAVALRLPEAEATFGLSMSRGRTLVLLTDPTSRVLPPLELLMTAYGLTLAEARVALLVGAGRAPKEAANELRTTWNTARAHLRQVFAKTRTSGQPALVRLLVQLGCVRL